MGTPWFWHSEIILPPLCMMEHMPMDHAPIILKFCYHIRAHFVRFWVKFSPFHLFLLYVSSPCICLVWACLCTFVRLSICKQGLHMRGDVKAWYTLLPKFSNSLSFWWNRKLDTHMWCHMVQYIHCEDHLTLSFPWFCWNLCSNFCWKDATHGLCC